MPVKREKKSSKMSRRAHYTLSTLTIITGLDLEQVFEINLFAM